MTRERPPLTDRDYAEVRNAVLQRIERRTWTIRAMQLGFAVVAIVIVIAFWPGKPATIAVVVPTPRQVAMRRSQSVAQTAAQAAVQPVTQAVARERGQRPALTKHQPRHHKRAPRKEERPEPLRIELATNDPDVRIIWITNPLESR